MESVLEAINLPNLAKEIFTVKFAILAIIGQLFVIAVFFALRKIWSRWRGITAWLAQSRVRYFRGIHFNALLGSIINPPGAQNSRILTLIEEKL